MLGGDMAVRFRAGEVKNLGSDLQKVVNGTCGNYKTAQKFAKKYKTKQMWTKWRFHIYKDDFVWFSTTKNALLLWLVVIKVYALFAEIPHSQNIH